MSLTERDESDLTALASELGDPESDARARQLMQTDPAAAEFFRQITSICHALQAQGERGLPPLSTEEAEALAATIRARAEKRRSERKPMWRHPWRWGSVAAAVAIAAITWFSWTRYSQPVVAEAVLIPISASLSQGRPRTPEHVQVRAGQPVETSNGHAVLNLANGNQVVVLYDSRFVIQRTGQTIELQRGALFVQNATPVRVEAGGLAVRLEGSGAKVLVSTTDILRVYVYAGGATLTRQGRDTRLSAGQLGSWDCSAEDVRIAPLRTEVEPWVKQALDQAAMP